MPDDDDSAQPPAGPSASPPAEPTPSALPPDQAPLPLQAPVANRAELLDRARHFLSSPQVVHQDHDSKRRFLVEKGLSDGEIQILLREMLPAVPARMYPAPPPSRIPGLLAGTFKVLSWFAGSSTVLLLIYYRFLLPRLTRSALARRSIKTHQGELLVKLTESLRAFKEEQHDAFANLPRLDPWEEHEPWSACKSLADVAAAAAADAEAEAQTDKPEGRAPIPQVTLLRCVLADLAGQNKPATADEIFNMLDATELPSLEIDEAYQDTLWKTLNDAPVFRAPEPASSAEPARWEYHTSDPPPPPPLQPALTKLHAATALAAAARSTQRFQHTLQALIDFTGYLTTKTYALASAMHRLPGTAAAAMPLEEEEVRMEIKALKGLVLNRRTFMPAIPRPSSAPIDKA
ncbi:hypothetical protein BC834DRAFT_867934 [Gloeopeniophorella convolvens]|nr:hypothetical protein BC834DRAFT_867934 [Gloeopeniophorella convolvens]